MFKSEQSGCKRESLSLSIDRHRRPFSAGPDRHDSAPLQADTITQVAILARGRGTACPGSQHGLRGSRKEGRPAGNRLLGKQAPSYPCSPFERQRSLWYVCPSADMTSKSNTHRFDQSPKRHALARAGFRAGGGLMRYGTNGRVQCFRFAEDGCIRTQANAAGYTGLHWLMDADERVRLRDETCARQIGHVPSCSQIAQAACFQGYRPQDGH